VAVSPSYSLVGTVYPVYPKGIYQSELVATPVITMTPRLASNAVDLVISGEIGRAYRVQTSPDLVHWSDHFSYTNTGTSYEYVDQMSLGAPQVFYRVVSP